MFGFSDLLSLIVSAFIILPVVVFLRETGYLIVSELFGVENPRLTIGSGPRVFKIGMFDIRKYYHAYSWFSFDSLRKETKFAYVSVYAGPIIMLLAIALTINFLLANDMIQSYKTFWDRFMFYAFFYLLFDVIPMKTVNGKPNNGMIIYEMLRYGKRVDYNQDPFIPATSEVEEEYQREMKEIEEEKEQEMEKLKEEKERKEEQIEEAEERTDKQKKVELKEETEQKEEEMEEVEEQKEEEMEEVEEQKEEEMEEVEEQKEAAKKSK